jgi:hypothetical protein
VSGDEGARDASEFLSRLRSRMPEELSVVLAPISRHVTLKFSMVVGVDCESVSVSVTTEVPYFTTPFSFTMTEQLDPVVQVWSGQSGDPHGIWVMEEDWDGSKVGMTHVESPHGLHWRSVCPPDPVLNPTVRFCAGVP